MRQQRVERLRARPDERIVLADAHVLARLVHRAALPHQYASRGNGLPAEAFDEAADLEGWGRSGSHHERASRDRAAPRKPPGKNRTTSSANAGGVVGVESGSLGCVIVGPGMAISWLVSAWAKPLPPSNDARS